ncbi:hypothetical protein [Alicyclobacillus acidiphilus]|uniref:hypothetical protein n=1 Tax=Alicyclobacillus acidiphilus TaxID=182455 RepID=UPI0012EED450|nr:hypothetical protein [Alicyclobacillus acidiphilus]
MQCVFRGHWIDHVYLNGVDRVMYFRCHPLKYVAGRWHGERFALTDREESVFTFDIGT